MKLIQQLDNLHLLSTGLLDQIRSTHTALEVLWNYDVLGMRRYHMERELEGAKENLLEEFRFRVHEALAEGRRVHFPDDFIEAALGIRNASEVWSRWDSKKIAAYRDKIFPDLFEAEWQQGLQTAAKLLGPALQNHGTSMHDPRFKRENCEDKLEISFNLYEQSVRNSEWLEANLQADVQSLYVALRVIQGIYDGSYYLADIRWPDVLKPTCGRKWSAESLCFWHLTRIESVPEIHVGSNRRLTLQFANAELLQRVKDALVPLASSDETLP